MTDRFYHDPPLQGEEQFFDEVYCSGFKADESSCLKWLKLLRAQGRIDRNVALYPESAARYTQHFLRRLDPSPLIEIVVHRERLQNREGEWEADYVFISSERCIRYSKERPEVGMDPYIPGLMQTINKVAPELELKNCVRVSWELRSIGQ